MSKITPKNLSYDSTLPPFLRRLQADSGPLDGRNEFQAARPKKARNPEDDAEDEPVYFDEESGETLTKREWEEKEREKEGGEDEVEGGRDGEAVDGSSPGAKRDGEKEKIAAIGGAKKRKAGRVVGADDEEMEDVFGEIKKVGKAGGKNVEKGKTAKKGKKVKLSFGDDE